VRLFRAALHWHEVAGDRFLSEHDAGVCGEDQVRQVRLRIHGDDVGVL